MNTDAHTASGVSPLTMRRVRIRTVIIFLALFFLWNILFFSYILKYSFYISPPTAFIVGIVICALASTAAYYFFLYRNNIHSAAERMVQEVYASREWFRHLYDLAPVPYIMLSLDGRMRQPNKAALRLFGSFAEDLYNREFANLFIKEDSENARQALENFKHGKPIVDQEMQITRKDGVTRFVLLSVLSFLAEEMGVEDGKGKYGLATFIDITDRKEVERAKTEFVSLASHQLRTPLAAIKWYTEALTGRAQKVPPEKRGRYLEKVYSSNQRMIELVDLLLNVSRIEVGTFVIEPEDISLSEISDKVLDGLAPQIQGKSLSVKKEYARTQALFSDYKLVQIVLENLFSNAVKYTPKGGMIAIRIEKKGTSTEISVSDTGYGIAPEEQGMIFSKLFRAKNAREIDPMGTGLGLYLTRRVIEMLGGSIHFTSELNKGTTFVTVLPPFNK